MRQKMKWLPPIFQVSRRAKIKGIGFTVRNSTPTFSKMTLLSANWGRPIWAALNIHKQEISLCLRHIESIGGSFPILLTISLSDPKDIDVLKEQCSKLVMIEYY